MAAALVRSFRWAPDLSPLPLLHKAIEAAPGAGALHRLVADIRRVNAALHDKGYPVARASRAALHRLCLRRWATPTLAPALYTRGFVGTEDLYRRAQPLCAYGALVPPPPLTLSRSAASHR